MVNDKTYIGFIEYLVNDITRYQRLNNGLSDGILTWDGNRMVYFESLFDLDEYILYNKEYDGITSTAIDDIKLALKIDKNMRIVFDEFKRLETIKDILNVSI